MWEEARRAEVREKAEGLVGEDGGSEWIERDVKAGVVCGCEWTKVKRREDEVKGKSKMRKKMVRK